MQLPQQLTTTRIAILLAVTGISTVASGIYSLADYYQDRMLPNTYINSIDVSGLTQAESIEVLNNTDHNPQEHTVRIAVDDISIASSSSELGFTHNTSLSVAAAFSQTHTPRIRAHVFAIFSSFRKKSEFPLLHSYDENKVSNMILALNQTVQQVGSEPSVTLKTTNVPSSITIFEGKSGRTIDFESTLTLLREMQTQNSTPPEELLVQATVASTSSVLNTEQKGQLLERTKKFVGKSILLRALDKKITIKDTELVSLINPIGTYSVEKISQKVQEVSKEINSQAQNAQFEYDSKSLEVKTFVPHKDGLEVASDKTSSQLVEILSGIESGSITDETLKNYFDINLIITSPEITLEKTNSLGIKERIGFGESYYEHSIPNRIHNVGITSDRVSLTIVPPQAEFSFNKTIGEVSARTGYRSAYVISGGKTVLGDGGGVCQVSSTLFRAVLNAGLDVTKRLQHSYRVSYYELNSEPGFDATVYSGDVDFRFKNDTQNHILIYSVNDPANLHMYIELYGTSDGRTTEISDYKQWDFRRAPQSEYYPTPDLPTGVKKQIDWSVSGIKTEFTHTVKNKDGNILYQDKYYSNYRPWSAKYMVGI